MSAPATATPSNYAAALRTMLTRTAAGTCPADMMQPKLLAACKQQMSKMGPALAAKGRVKTLTLLKADMTGGREETYKVTFEKVSHKPGSLAALRTVSFSDFILARSSMNL